jgi:hypothetical protein
MKKTILFTLALILTACSFSASFDLNRNTSKWKAANITHYRYQLFIGCFCPFRDQMPLTIEVNNGTIVSMTTADGTPVSASDPSYTTYAAYSTIDNIFLALKTELAGGADEVTVTYDPTYGYPANVFIDQIKQAVDDELSLQISNFEVLK